MSQIIQDGVAFIAFAPNPDGTVKIAGFCPEEYDEDHIVRASYLATAAKLQEIFALADAAAKEELTEEGHDIEQIIKEVYMPESKIITDIH